ncbi:MAG: NADH-quinone oxidoreductase subunit J [Planctomycetota bacterium]|nr:NADH-quinone oxidoreductase subunit J [Planctomycetota bacterium]MCB9901674.1 NADH-quinone oxidoreductase subunit J [Planctomycetota bacterium]
MATQVLYILFGGMALGAALLAVTRKNPVASAIWLVVMFFGLAATYVVMEAFFVGAIQILVYAGAIMVLFLFVIMLLDLRQQMLEGKPTTRLRFFGVLAALLFLVVGVVALGDAKDRGLLHRAVTPLPREADIVAANPDATSLVDLPLDGTAGAIADEMFTRWVLPFEVASVILLGAILGAVILTKRRLT